MFGFRVYAGLFGFSAAACARSGYSRACPCTHLALAAPVYLLLAFAAPCLAVRRRGFLQYEPASGNSTLVMLVVMLVERVFLVSGVVKTVFPPNKKNRRKFFFFHHEQKRVKLTSWVF